MNRNSIITTGWSNEDSKRIHELGWPDEPQLAQQYSEGRQCGGCSFFAPFNADYGLCCNTRSRHHLETVIEHFTCPVYVQEGWGPHSFTEDAEFHCRCGGEPATG